MAHKRRCPATQNDGDFTGGVEVAGGKESIFFFKIILAPALQDNKLAIPNKFARDFSNDLSSMAKLVVPASQSWAVSIRSEGGKFWFCDELEEFFKFYSVSRGYFLVFDYRGNSVFGVRIFDLTACEISYPSNSASHQSSPLNRLDRTPLLNKQELLTDDDDDEDDANCNDDDDDDDNDDDDDDDDDVVMLDDPPVVSNRADVIELSGDDEGIEDQPSASKWPSTRKIREEFEMESSNVDDEIGSIGKNVRSKNLQVDSDHEDSSMKKPSLQPHVANNPKPKNASFKAVMRDNLDKPFLEVPSDIGRKYPRGMSGMVTLEVSDGRTWTVQGNFFRGRLKSLGKGWAEFVRDNKLKLCHTCVFELIEFDKEFRMKVSGWTGYESNV